MDYQQRHAIGRIWAAMAVALSVSTGLKASENASTTVDEIIVTAQKRSEDVASVPLAVTALTAETIEHEDLNAFVDLVKAVPALTIKTGRNLQTSSISMRGIGTFSTSVGIEPSVSIVVDDVAVVQQAQAFNNLIDIARIEVLEGPQSTLFGKNAIAGVVNIVTQDPSPVLTAALHHSLAQGDERHTEAMLSGPLSERSGYRLSAYHQTSAGDITDLTNGLKLNNSDGQGVRGKLRFYVGDRVEATLIADCGQTTSRGNARTFRSLPAMAQLYGLIPVKDFASGIYPGPANRAARLDTVPQVNTDQTTVALRSIVKLGFQELVSISSYQQWHYFNVMDTDASDADVLGAVTGGAAHGGISQSTSAAVRQYAEELRLSSAPGQVFEYLVGLYFSDARTTRRTQAGPIFMTNNFATALDASSSAVFVQSSYRPGSNSKVTAGVRLNHQHDDVTLTDLQRAIPVTYAGDSAESKLTGKLSWQRNFAVESTMFATVSTGYKGAGYDLGLPATSSKVSNPVRAETSTSFDAGIRMRLPGHGLRLNATVFLTDFRDFQFPSIVLDPVTLELDSIVTNLGKVRTQGLETEVQWQAAPGWWLAASAASIDATIKSFELAPCWPKQTQAQGCIYLGVGPPTNTVQQVRGNSLFNAPKFKFNINSRYELPRDRASRRWFLDLNYVWQSKINFDVLGDPAQLQGAYGLLNASAGIEDATESKWHYSASLFVRNLLNKVYAGQLDDASASYSGVQAASVVLQVLPRDSQRYFGLKAAISF